MKYGRITKKNKSVKFSSYVNHETELCFLSQVCELHKFFKQVGGFFFFVCVMCEIMKPQRVRVFFALLTMTIFL